MPLLLHPSSNTVCHSDNLPSIEPIHLFLHQSIAGTMGYIPPEAIRRESGVQVSTAEFKKGDVYSFGVLMCYILSGINPFAKMTEANIVFMIAAKNERPAIPPHVDKDSQNPVFKEMIQQLWHRDPECRSDFKTIVEQLSAHVVDPKSPKPESTAPSRFLRTLPPLHAGAKHLFVFVGLGWEG